jgi:hypothetical protein
MSQILEMIDRVAEKLGQIQRQNFEMSPKKLQQ